jgi:hypothetical protein
MLVSIRPEYQTLSSQDVNDDHPALPLLHNAGDSRSRTPKSASKAESATEAFDITDMSRSETAREEGAIFQFVQCLRGFDDKRNEPWPPFPCEHFVSKASRNTRSLPPAFSCVEVIFNAFLTSASVRLIWHGVQEVEVLFYAVLI